MAPPFVSLTIADFARLLDEWFSRHQRAIDEVHMHHTWRPNHAQYRGHESIVGMWRHHTQVNGWSDIAQHVSIAPDGTIWTGRHWDRPPASSGGHNGSPTHGPFMFEIIGDFDAGKDKLEGKQRDSVLWVIGLVLHRFGLKIDALRFHRELGSPKTCPGTGIDHQEIAKAVQALLGKPVPELAAPRGISTAPRFCMPIRSRNR